MGRSAVGWVVGGWVGGGWGDAALRVNFDHSWPVEESVVRWLWRKHGEAGGKEDDCPDSATIAAACTAAWLAFESAAEASSSIVASTAALSVAASSAAAATASAKPAAIAARGRGSGGRGGPRGKGGR